LTNHFTGSWVEVLKEKGKIINYRKKTKKEICDGGYERIN
jgi:hypothetical protein